MKSDKLQNMMHSNKGKDNEHIDEADKVGSGFLLRMLKHVLGCLEKGIKC